MRILVTNMHVHCDVHYIFQKQYIYIYIYIYSNYTNTFDKP